MVGNVDAYLSNQGIPHPDIWHCLYFTAYQPLLTLAIISIPTFRMWDFIGSIAATCNFFAMVAVLLLTIFHEYQGREDYAQEKWYRSIIWVAWVLYLLLILWLAHASEDSPNKEKAHPPSSSTKQGVEHAPCFNAVSRLAGLTRPGARLPPTPSPPDQTGLSPRTIRASRSGREPREGQTSNPRSASPGGTSGPP